MQFGASPTSAAILGEIDAYSYSPNLTSYLDFPVPDSERVLRERGLYELIVWRVSSDTRLFNDSGETRIL